MVSGRRKAKFQPYPDLLCLWSLLDLPSKHRKNSVWSSAEVLFLSVCRQSPGICALGVDKEAEAQKQERQQMRNTNTNCLILAAAH